MMLWVRLRPICCASGALKLISGPLVWRPTPKAYNHRVNGNLLLMTESGSCDYSAYGSGETLASGNSEESLVEFLRGVIYQGSREGY